MGASISVDFSREIAALAASASASIQQKTPMPVRRVLIPGKQQLTRKNTYLAGIEIFKEKEDAITGNPTITQ